VKLRHDGAELPAGSAVRKKALLLGLGLDGKDGHLRLTVGDNFRLIGGSQQTHALMQEKAVKFNEELGKRGKQLEDLSRVELLDIADKVKLSERS
jgi:hypothetical protein